MKTKQVVILALVLFVAGCVSAVAQVTVNMTAVKVVVVNEKETFQPAEKAKPGDVIEYRAEYFNKGAKATPNVVGTIPVPSGMEYIADSAVPALASASAAGADFGPLPLKKKVVRNGQTVEEVVPPSQYKAVRWNFGTMQPNAKVTVRARMRIAKK